MLRVLFSFMITLCLCAPSAAHHGGKRTPERSINNVHVVLLVLDGVGAGMLNQALARGDLPTVQQHFIEQGVRFTEARTVFPAITTAAYVSMLSGLYPGHMGIPYLERFDRMKQRPRRFLGPHGRSEINQSFGNWYREQHSSAVNYDTIFDALAGHPTANVVSLFDRGASFSYPRFPFGIGWDVVVARKPERMNRHSYRAIDTLFARAPEDIPRFTIAGLLATDGVAHTQGVKSSHIPKILREFDQWLAEFILQLKERSLWQKTYLVITSDHGTHEVENKIDLRELFYSEGSALTVPNTAIDWDDECYFGQRGVSAALLTLRGANDWQLNEDFTDFSQVKLQNGETVDILSPLRKSQKIAWTLTRGATQEHANGSIRSVNIFTREAHGIIYNQLRNGKLHYRYTPIKNNPLHVFSDTRYRPLIGRWLTAHEWERQLIDSNTPHIVPQFGHIFNDRSAGDIVVVAKPQYSFYKRKAATHGDVFRHDQHVPLLMRGPGLTPATRKLASIVDLYPTMLQWFGLPYDQKIIDGRPLFAD